MIEEGLYKEYLSHLMAGNRKPCVDMVQRLLKEGIEIRLLYTDLFQRSLYEIGEFWEKGKISVALEHLATSITESLLNLVYPALFSGERCGNTAVIACVANEYHQIGAKMVADLFELKGWDSYFLGANSPVQDLISMLEEKHPDLLGLSLSIYLRLPELTETIQAVRNVFPDLRILVGGQALRWGGRAELEAALNVTCIDSLTQLETLIHGN